MRRLGAGFIGVSELPIATAVSVGTSSGAGLSPNDRVVISTVTAPTLGARVWLSRAIGFDAGLGFAYSGGKVSAELGDITSEVEKQSILAFLVHAGVPLMIADITNMCFLVVPEVTFGVARSNVAPLFEENAPPEAELFGARLDLGVRAGTEIHFGFMGLPRLSLEAGIGLIFKTEWASATVANQSITDTSMKLTTTSFSDPWDIFGGVANVSARYYF